MLRHYPRESQQQRGEMADETNTSVLLPIDIEAEMRKSYLDYAMSVIIARALPDVRDGLKPVQRRILVAMNDLGLASNRGYRKRAKICGDTSGNYHPHGEAVIYPARSEEHTSELQSQSNLVCRLLLDKKNLLGFSCCFCSHHPQHQRKCHRQSTHLQTRSSPPRPFHSPTAPLSLPITPVSSTSPAHR